MTPAESTIDLDDDLFETVAAEFLARFRAGDQPSVEAFAQRYPSIAAEIRELFPTIVAVERVKLQKEHSSDGRVSMGARKIERLGDYRIIREIGRGGMGVVYEAEQESLKRRVAVKVLPPHALMDDVQVRRFQREAQTAAGLHHTNIVPVFGVGQEDGLHYYVMQYIDGCGLDEFYRHQPRGPKEIRQACEMIRQIADAVQLAHDHGTLHRDIKPANILVDRQGNVWITDFGLARALETDETRTDHLGGTLRYMAPERFAGRAEAASDLYSLGITLYELVTGTRAYEGRSSGELFSLIMQEPPRSARSLNPQVPADLDTILEKAIARDPAHRYRSVREFEQDLGRFFEGVPILARPVTPPERLWRWCRRNPALATSLAAAASLLLLVAVISGTGYLRTSQLNAELTAALDRGRTALDNERQARAKAESLANLSLEALNGIFERFAPSTGYTITLPADDGLAQGDGTDEPILLPPQSSASPEVAAALEGLLPYYQRLAEETGQDLRVRRQVAEARHKLGLIYRQLGRYEAALAELQSAQALVTSLDQPADGVAGTDAVELARFTNDLGEVERLNSHFTQARASHARALELLTKGEADPRSDEASLELARTHYLLGRRELFYGTPGGGLYGPPPGGGPRSPRSDRNRPPREPDEAPPDRGSRDLASTGDRPGRPPADSPGPFPPPPPPEGPQSPAGPPRGESRRPPGGEDFRRRLEERRQHLETAVTLLRKFPEQTRDTRVTLLLARCYRELANVHGRDPRERDQREQEWQDAIDLLTGLVETSPEVQEFRFDLSEAYADFDLRGLPDEELPVAVERLERALQLNQDLVRRAPDVPAYQSARTQIRFKLGLLYRRIGELSKAAAVLQEALAAQRLLARAEPEGIMHVLWIGRLSQELGWVLVNEERFDEALSVLGTAAGELQSRFDKTETEDVETERRDPNLSAFFVALTLSETYARMSRIERDHGDAGRAAEFETKARAIQEQLWSRRREAGNSRERSRRANSEPAPEM